MGTPAPRIESTHSSICLGICDPKTESTHVIEARIICALVGTPAPRTESIHL